MRRLISLLLFILLSGSLLAPIEVIAQDLISKRAWLEDPNGQLNWKEVREKNFQPYEGILSKGYGQSAIWLRLHIDPGKAPATTKLDDRLILRIRPVYLDDIQVFDPLDPNGLTGVTGDLHHPRADEFQSLEFLLPLARGKQPRDIWLRLVSASTRQIDVQAMSIDALNQRTQTQSLVFSLYIGLLSVLAIWGGVYWIFSQETLIGIFGIKQIAALLFALSSLGYMRLLWPMDWPAWTLDNLSSLLGIIAVSAAVWFHVVLVREFSPPSWMQRIHQVMLAIQPLKILMLMAGWTTLALRLNMSEVMVTPVILLLSALLSTGWKKPIDERPALSRAVVLTFYTFLLIVLLGASLPALGLIGGSEIALYVVQLHGLTTAFFVLLILQYRAHVIQKLQRETALALERSLMQTHQERAIREEQEKLLTMLAHELKTPLATMQMRLDSNASGSREIKLAIRDMNNVVERCQQTLKLSDKHLLSHIESMDLVSTVRDAAASCTQPQRVELNLPVSLRIRSDRQLWFIVLNNLLENGCKYAQEGSPILVHLSALPNNEGMQLEIANQPGSAGWPDQQKVFEKYYRSPLAKRQAGTGLGLFLVHNLIQAIGGSIEYSPTNTMIRFVIRIPASSMVDSAA